MIRVTMMNSVVSCKSKEDVVCKIQKMVFVRYERKQMQGGQAIKKRKSRQHDIRRPPRNSDDSDHESIYSGGEGTGSHWNQATRGSGRVTPPKR